MAMISKARGDGTEQSAGVEHLIVEREVADGDEVQASGLLLRPMACAQVAAGLLQRSAVRLTSPVRLKRELEFAGGANAGKTEDMCLHDVLQKSGKQCGDS